MFSPRRLERIVEPREPVKAELVVVGEAVVEVVGLQPVVHLRGGDSSVVMPARHPLVIEHPT